MLKQKLGVSKKSKKVSLRVTATLLALISSYSFVSAEKLDLTASNTAKPNNVQSLNGKTTTAIGFDNFANNGATSIGYSNEGWTSSVVVGSGNFGVNSATVIGINSKAVGGIAIGKGAIASQFNTGVTLQKRHINEYAAAVGNSSLAVDGTSFGYNARSNNSGAAIGESSNALNGGTALGNGTTIGGATYDLHRGGAVALGDRAVADRTFGKYGYIPFDKNFTADLSLRYGDARANDIALAKASGDAAVIKTVTDFYKNNNISADTYSEWKRLRQTYMAYYQGYNQQLAKMTTTTYADEVAREADYKHLQAWDKAQKDASSELDAFEAANNIDEKSVAAKNSILATYKSTEGAVSVGRSAVYDANGNIIRQAQTRQIINVAAGSADTDAVNVAQLKTVVSKVTEFNNAINQNITDLTNRVDNIDKSVSNLVNNNNSTGGQGSNQGTTNPGMIDQLITPEIQEIQVTQVIQAIPGI